MKNLLSKSILLIVLSILLFGCKKGDITDPENGVYKAPKIVNSENLVNFPAEAQQYSESAMATSLVGSINGMFSTYKDFLKEIPDGAEYSTLKTTTDVWTWNAGGMNIRVEGSDQGVLSQVRLYINGVMVADLKEYRDIIKGENKLYKQDGTLAVEFINEVSGTTTEERYLLYSDDGTYYIRAVGSTLDPSGYLNIYKGSDDTGSQVYHCQWTASGSCSGWLRDPETGKSFSFPTN